MVDVSEIPLYTISIFWDNNCCIIALNLFQQGVVKASPYTCRSCNSVV